jgi:hypothetical protein
VFDYLKLREAGMGILFGSLGCMTFGAIFVPLAALCSVFGLFCGPPGRNAVGIGASLLAGVLSVVGFFISPTVWLFVAGYIGAVSW